MARRKRHEEHENHERWLISYADFITLLFAFFVVMYSISAVNEGKYRVLSDTLSTSFQHDNGATGIDHIQLNDASNPHEQPVHTNIILADLPFTEAPEANANQAPESDVQSDQQDTPPVANDEQADKAAEAALSTLSEEVMAAMSPFIEQNLVEVKKNQYWLEIEMKSSLLFTSGQARLSSEAMQPLREIAKILQPMSNPIFIEGYTDNIPIKNLVFPSNWELSAARAASVVNLFGKLGINSKRLAAIGYGEHHPIASNKSNEGRDKNRRVSIIVMADAKNKRPLEVYQKGRTTDDKVVQ